MADLQPQMCFASQIIEGVLRKAQIDFVVTSVNDKTHGVGSFHSKGKAFDFRTHDYMRNGYPDVRKTRLGNLLVDLKNALGNEFDVLIEDINKPNEHGHVEWDPE